MTSGINLFVAPLDKNVTDEFLKQQFNKFGELFSATVAKDEFGNSKNFGFVHFVSMADGLRAKEEMNEKTLLTREIHVDFANNQDRRFYDSGAKESIWANELDSNAVGDCESAFDEMSIMSDGTEDPSRYGTSDVKERMKKLFELQQYTDVTFYSKGDRRESISAHRAILAVGSPLFTEMLFGEGKQHSAGMKMEVEISNIAFRAFTNIVKYLYTDEVFFESDSLVLDILEGAKQFEIPSLVRRCEKHFEKLPITVQNVCSILEMSISKKMDVLKERCVEFIQNNTLQVINSDDFHKCSLSTVRTICCLPSFNLHSEKELLTAVISWSQVQPNKAQKQMADLLKRIRFLTFTVDELAEAMKTHKDLLVAEDGLKIMLYLCNPTKTGDFSSLPSWLNKNTLTRCCFSDNLHGSQIGLNASRILGNDAYVGRVTFPLKSSGDQLRPVSQLTSLLQMKCIAGRHVIKAVRLAFQPPVSDRSVIGNLCIRVHVHPADFKTLEKIQIGNSESVRVEFSKTIKARMGDLVDIEVDASDIRFYRFLVFDESGRMPHNPHFQCCVSSRPKEEKMYFISELEYGPQDNVRQPGKRMMRGHPRKKF